MQKKCEQCKYRQVATYKEPGRGEWYSESCEVRMLKRPFCKRYLETKEEKQKEE